MSVGSRAAWCTRGLRADWRMRADRTVLGMDAPKVQTTSVKLGECGVFGRGGLRFERMNGADARPGCLVGAGQRGVPVGCVQFGECGQIGWGTRPGRLLGMKGVAGRGVDVAGPVGFVWLVCASVGFGECG